jgi:hypothetical protein
MIQNLLLGGHILLRKKTIKHLSKSLLTSQRYVVFNASFIVNLISAKINTCQSEHDALVWAATVAHKTIPMFGHFKEIGSQHNIMTISSCRKIVDNSISS